MFKLKSLLILDQEQSDLGPRSFFTVLQNVLSGGVFPPPACSVSVSLVPKADAPPRIPPGRRETRLCNGIPPTPVYSRSPTVMRERKREKDGEQGEREREKGKIAFCTGLGDARRLLGKTWRCPRDQPVGSVPQSSDHSFPLLRSHFSVPPSPIPTITAGRIRPPRGPGCSLAGPPGSECPAPSVDHEARETFLRSTTEGPGKGQGLVLIPGPLDSVRITPSGLQNLSSVSWGLLLEA